MSIRRDLGDTLIADWKTIPALAGLDVVVTEKPLGDIRKTTALIRGKSISREPSAPQSHRRVGCLVTIISPSGDLDKAADELDELLWAVLAYLDKTFPHDDAEWVGYGSRLLAVDIPVHVIAQKD